MSIETIYVNPDDINDGFWNYNITITIENKKFIVNANHVQDALDYIVDYCEEYLPGLLIDPDDEDDQRDMIIAGNHSRFLSVESIHLENIQRIG